MMAVDTYINWGFGTPHANRAKPSDYDGQDAFEHRFVVGGYGVNVARTMTLKEFTSVEPSYMTAQGMWGECVPRRALSSEDLDERRRKNRKHYLASLNGIPVRRLPDDVDAYIDDVNERIREIRDALSKVDCSTPTPQATPPKPSKPPLSKWARHDEESSKRSMISAIKHAAGRSRPEGTTGLKKRRARARQAALSLKELDTLRRRVDEVDEWETDFADEPSPAALLHELWARSRLVQGGFLQFDLDDATRERAENVGVDVSEYEHWFEVEEDT